MKAIYKHFSDGWQKPTLKQIDAEVNKAGLLKPDLAPILGISMSQLYRLCDGTSEISYPIWALLCFYTGSMQPEVMNERKEDSQKHMAKGGSN